MFVEEFVVPFVSGYANDLVFNGLAWREDTESMERKSEGVPMAIFEISCTESLESPVFLVVL
jgi:hypothetical protein